MKKLLIIFSVVLVCGIMLTPVNAEILPSDYSEAGEYMVYDYWLESCRETTLWSKLDYDENGNLKEFFKTTNGITVEYFYREIDPNKELNDDNIETIYYEIPNKYAGLKTLSGEQIILTQNLPLDFGEVELENGERLDFSYELIDSDLMYPAYTLDGRGVDFKEVYGLYGDVNYIYVLAGEPFPEYTVTLLPDTTYELLTNPLWKNEEEENIKFSGTVNDFITLPECTYEKPGYQFAYWADGVGEYQSGDSYRIPNRDVTLNAMWIKIDDSVVSDSDNNIATIIIISVSAVALISAVVVVTVLLTRKKKGGAIPPTLTKPWKLCPNCKNTVVSSRYCEKCGYDMSASEPPPHSAFTRNPELDTTEDKPVEKKACPKCRHLNSLDTRFCEKCGFSFEKTDSHFVRNPSLSDDKKTCPKCGTEFKYGCNFCHNCGYSNSEAQPMPTGIETSNIKSTMRGVTDTLKSTMDVKGESLISEDDDRKKKTDTYFSNPPDLD